MSRQKIHPDSRARSRVWQAQNRARLKNLTPVEKFAEAKFLPVPYTAEEAALAHRIHAMSLELETLAGDLNRRLVDRLGADLAGGKFLEILEGAFTRIQIANY